MEWHKNLKLTKGREEETKLQKQHRLLCSSVVECSSGACKTVSLSPCNIKISHQRQCLHASLSFMTFCHCTSNWWIMKMAKGLLNGDCVTTESKRTPYQRSQPGALALLFASSLPSGDLPSISCLDRSCKIQHGSSRSNNTQACNSKAVVIFPILYLRWHKRLGSLETTIEQTVNNSICIEFYSFPSCCHILLILFNTHSDEYEVCNCISSLWIWSYILWVQ